MIEQQILSRIEEISKNTDYYSPYSTSNSVDELVSIIKDLLDLIYHPGI